MAAKPPLDAWEAAWAPYDQGTYELVCAAVSPHETLLEIGAGDLRLARLLARKARRVVAVEIQAGLVRQALAEGPLPSNLYAVVADARSFPVPQSTSTAVLLMRHCTHFRLYARRLKRAGVRRLITNARWRMGVEEIDLDTARQEYDQLPLGWYACFCGAAGFKAGLAEYLTPALDAIQHEVDHCPSCTQTWVGS